MPPPVPPTPLELADADIDAESVVDELDVPPLPPVNRSSLHAPSAVPTRAVVTRAREV
jgi:hypothetical protein